MGELLLVVQAKTQTRSHPTAPARPLVGGGLTDGFDRQAKHSGLVWNREIRAFPKSITARTPGTVTLVSATLVASTMRRRVPEANTLAWSSTESRPYSGRFPNGPPDGAAAGDPACMTSAHGSHAPPKGRSARPPLAFRQFHRM